ncbi:MAG: hypothetical protein QM756_04775 [Polyangiaceae bacterium]
MLGEFASKQLTVAWVIGCVSACASVPHSEHADEPSNHAPEVVDELAFHCARKVMGRDSPYRMPLAGKEANPELARYLSMIPPGARRTAFAAGLEPLLSRLFQANSGESGSRAAAFGMQDELTLRLVAFDAQVSSAAIEAGCTADMIRKVSADVAHRQQDRQLALTVTSLVLGAVSSTAAGAWTLADEESGTAPIVLGVAGGVVSTSFAFGALTDTPRAITYRHARNRLTPLWRGADPDHLYPSFVFRMLTLPTEGGEPPPRERMIQSWFEAAKGVLTPWQMRALFEGDGGEYDDRLLSLRAAMFEDLESEVQGVARDLELLDRALVRALFHPNLVHPPPAMPR